MSNSHRLDLHFDSRGLRLRFREERFDVTEGREFLLFVLNLKMFLIYPHLKGRDDDYTNGWRPRVKLSKLNWRELSPRYSALKFLSVVLVQHFTYVVCTFCKKPSKSPTNHSPLSFPPPRNDFMGVQRLRALWWFSLGPVYHGYEQRTGSHFCQVQHFNWKV